MTRRSDINWPPRSCDLTSFDVHSPITEAIVKKFEETGVVTNIERRVHHRFAHPVENIGIVNETVAEDPNVLIPYRSQELGLCYGTLRRILHFCIAAHAAT